MKYLSIIYILLCIPSFSIVNEREELHILASLPTNFSYQVDSDSIAILNNRRDMPRITYTNEEITIGCYHPVKVKPLFSLSIGHQFLFEGIQEFDLFVNEKKISDYRLIFYGIKKENHEKDSLLLNALNEYCIYGQLEYIFQSDEFILFTYSFATNSRGTVNYLEKLGFWEKIETNLKNNLNEGASFKTKVQSPVSVKNSYHKEDIVKGKFIWESGNAPAIFQTYLELNDNNKSVWISNYNQPKSSWNKYDYLWFMDNTYIYVFKYQSDCKIFRIEDENTLINIDEEYKFSRM